MTSLSDGEWRAYCLWESGLHPRPLSYYSCHEQTVVRAGPCSILDPRPCTTYSWGEFSCYERGTRVRYQSNPACQNTLAQEAACQEALANGPPCHLAFPLPPECEYVMNCPTDPYMTPDSGMIDVSVNPNNPALDRTQRLSTLSSADWATLCQWTADLIPVDRYYCDAEDENRGDVMCDGCVLVDRTFEECTASDAVAWQERSADCLPTVADWLQCSRDRLYESFDCALSGPDSCRDLRPEACPRR